MSDRLEVLIGPGTVLRFGRVVAWVGAGASPALLTFLHQSLRNVGRSPHGGRQLVDHVAGILAARDPEPGAAFVAVGPSDGEWLGILHGPVQLWDGSQWLAPTPRPGWLHATLLAHPALCAGPAGSPAPRVIPNSPYDLAEGVVPGGGFVLVPAESSLQPGAHVPTADPSALNPVDGGDAAPLVEPPPEPADPTGEPADEPAAEPAEEPAPQPAEEPAEAPPQTAPAASDPPGAAATAPTRHGALGGVGGHGAPLPAVGDPADPREALRPLVPGLRCPSGHFNHARARRCVRCRQELVGAGPVNGPRPPLGVLIADDGTIYRVDGDLVVGSSPGADPPVLAGRASPLQLVGAGGSVAPSHAELRVNDWELTVTDRGSAPGTHIVRPGRSGWERLLPFQPEPLLPGSHLAFGQRVVTFVSPWPLGETHSP